MDNQQNSIPLPIAKILVGYFALTATEQEHNQLDEWICESDENTQIFCECLEVARYRPQRFDPFKDDYTPPEFWIVADYFVKHTDKTITPIEQQALVEWRSMWDWNDRVFNERPRTTDRVEMFNWLIRKDWENREEMRIL